MNRDLTDVLDEIRTDAFRLKRTGNAGQADYLERIASEVAEVMRDFLDWLTEDEAMLQSGMARTTLRARFGEWASCAPPMAKFEGTGRRARRLYRRCVVPRKANKVAAYLAGLKAS